MSEQPAPRRRRLFARNAKVDVSEEIGFHLEMRVRDYIEAGMSPDDARKAAAQRFGDVGSVARDCATIDGRIARQDRRSETLQATLKDLQLAGRLLRRAPGYAMVAVLTLALGIGGVTAIYSVLRSVVLRSLPYPEAGRLTRIQEVKSGQPPWAGVSIPDLLDWRERSRSFEHLAVVQVGTGVNLTGGDEPIHLPAAIVSDRMFDVLGVTPALGRGFEPGDHQQPAPAGVVLGNGLWRRRFGGDPQIVGRPIELNGRQVLVRGVMPGGFTFPDPSVELWLPLPIVRGAGYATPNGRWARFFRAYGRTRPGVTLEQAQTEMTAIAAQLTQENPGPNRDLGVLVTPLKSWMVGGTGRTLWIMLGAAGFVLLIACANVSNLGLVRLLARSREIAIRLAHGATRRDLARQFLAESLVLAVLGGALGTVLAFAAVRVLVAAGPAALPRLNEVRVDLGALGVTLGIALLIAIGLGLAPLWLSARRDVSATLRGGTRETEGRRQGAVRHGLVVSQVALAVVLLAGAGLLAASYVRLTAVRPGFAADRVVSMLLPARGAAYRASPTALPQLFDRLLARVRAVPGVQSAAVAGGPPLIPGGTGWTYVPEGITVQPGQEPSAMVHPVSDDYFRTMGIPLLAGRAVEPRDLGGPADVAVVNQSLAKQVFGAENPIGKRIALGSVGSANPPMTIVGVVGDVRGAGLGVDPGPEIYQPYAPSTLGQDLTLLIRTTGDPTAIVGSVRDAIHEIDRTLPLTQIRTMEAVVAASVAAERFVVTLIGVFAGLALAIAAVGIFGIVAQSVAQESRAIAIRMALGARAGQIVAAVCQRGLVLVGAGVVIGLIAALGLTRILEKLLYGVSPTDPLVMAGVVVAFGIVAGIACLLPARRAATADPAAVLRAD